MSRTRRDSQGQQSARASHSRRVSNSQGETTSTTPTTRNGPVVSDDEAESTPVKVKPTAIFASLGQSLGLAVQGVCMKCALVRRYLFVTLVVS